VTAVSHASRGAAERRRLLLAVASAYATALAAAVAVALALPNRHPILVAALADVAATAVVFLFSLRHDNSSLYDPYWSVAPVPITLYWAFANPEGLGLRQALALALVGAWGLRLTANCLARWRSLSQEDFRYAEIRARTGRGYWPASLVSIHLLPTAWVFLGLLPLYPVLAGAPGRVSALDVLAAAATAVAIAIEALSDLQLRAFLDTRRHPEEVLATGLWAFSRHPNYFGEVLFWWGIFLFALSGPPGWTWTAVGPLSITGLFLFVSVPWMDRHMQARHPAYEERLRTTSALLPWPARRF
jgi:steroid 5-alpha reductase family enzyme